MAFIQGPDYFGCVLLAVSEAAIGFAETIETIRNRLAQLLREDGSGLFLDDNDQLTFGSGDFPEWTYAGGLFTLTVQTAELTAGVSFFEVDPPKPKIQAAFGGMSTIDVVELEPYVPLPHDAFLFLPLNRKVIRYLKVGSSLSPKQWEKLRKMSGPRMMIKNGDAQAFRLYCARVSIEKEVKKIERKEGEAKRISAQA